jgi:hypothetical protein
VKMAPADRAVPPGRLGHDNYADLLLLHTLQAAAAFEQIEHYGRLRPDPRPADADFTDAYDWMLPQMG